jgi:hypothetical protein
MKFILKVSCFLILMLAGIPITSFAQDVVVDTSSPRNPLISPAIVVEHETVEPHCHTYTGCKVIVAKKYYVQQHSKPKPKPKRYFKSKIHCVYYPPC